MLTGRGVDNVPRKTLGALVESHPTDEEAFDGLPHPRHGPHNSGVDAHSFVKERMPVLKLWAIPIRLIEKQVVEEHFFVDHRGRPYA